MLLLFLGRVYYYTYLSAVAVHLLLVCDMFAHTPLLDTVSSALREQLQRKALMESNTDLQNGVACVEEALSHESSAGSRDVVLSLYEKAAHFFLQAIRRESSNPRNKVMILSIVDEYLFRARATANDNRAPVQLLPQASVVALREEVKRSLDHSFHCLDSDTEGEDVSPVAAGMCVRTCVCVCVCAHG
jgi:cell division protein FtsX